MLETWGAFADGTATDVQLRNVNAWLAGGEKGGDTIAEAWWAFTDGTATNVQLRNVNAWLAGGEKGGDTVAEAWWAFTDGTATNVQRRIVNSMSEADKKGRATRTKQREEKWEEMHAELREYYDANGDSLQNLEFEKKVRKMCFMTAFPFTAFDC
jgi:hypothetical protein